MQIYDKGKELLDRVVADLSILAGDEEGPSGVRWQEVAGTAALNLRQYATFLDTLRKGERHFQGCPLEGPVVFPSPKQGEL